MHKTILLGFGLLGLLSAAKASISPIVPYTSSILQVNPHAYSANVVQSVADSRGFSYSTVQQHHSLAPTNLEQHFNFGYHVSPAHITHQIPTNFGNYYFPSADPFVSNNLVPVQQFETTPGIGSNIGSFGPNPLVPTTAAESPNSDADSVVIDSV